MGRLFGTDGVRGVANKDLTNELAMQIGMAAAEILIKDLKDGEGKANSYDWQGYSCIGRYALRLRSPRASARRCKRAFRRRGANPCYAYLVGKYNCAAAL
jgi:phosphoglucosamine mutase